MQTILDKLYLPYNVDEPSSRPLVYAYYFNLEYHGTVRGVTGEGKYDLALGQNG